MKRNLYTTIVASVGISVFLVSGSLYAQSNEGRLVQEWYKARTLQIAAQLTDSTVVQGVLEASQSFRELSDDLANQAEVNLSKKVDIGNQEVTTSIQTASEGYIGQMEETAIDLAEMTRNQLFDPYISAATSESVDEFEQLAEDTIKELTQLLDGGETLVDGNEE